MAKNRDKYTLFLPKRYAHTSSYEGIKRQKNRLLTCGHNDTRRVSLHPILEFGCITYAEGEAHFYLRVQKENAQSIKIHCILVEVYFKSEKVLVSVHS